MWPSSNHFFDITMHNLFFTPFVIVQVTWRELLSNQALPKLYLKFEASLPFAVRESLVVKQPRNSPVGPCKIIRLGLGLGYDFSIWAQISSLLITTPFPCQ